MSKVTYLIGLFLLPILAGPGEGTEIFVPDTYPTIMDAVYCAVDGDEVVVRPGTYTEMIGFLGKKITIRGEAGAAETVIDGAGVSSVVSFVFGEGNESVLEGFTITNGLSYWGGGIYTLDSSPVITDVIVADNVGINGGGICCEGASTPIITRSTITRNFAFKAGGGISCISASPLISHNLISQNRVVVKPGKDPRSIKEEFGGGIYLNGSRATIVNNRILNNWAGGTGGRRGFGGGICCRGGGKPTVGNNIFFSNQTTYGGGISCSGTQMTVTGNTFMLNSAVAGGTGGALFCSEGGHLAVTNSILWKNSAVQGGDEIALVSAGTTGSMAITHSDVRGGQAGVFVGTGCQLNWKAGNIDTDPLFVEAARGDLHIRYDSPCRDAGALTAGVDGLQDDFEGDPRNTGAMPDIGADEFWRHLYPVGDRLPGADVAIRVTGHPGLGPVLVAATFQSHDIPVGTIWGDLYLKAPVIWQKNLGMIPQAGFVDIPLKIPAHYLPGRGYPMQAMIGLPANPNSKLTNLLLF